MSHEIREHDSMAYVGAVPWHGLGTPLDKVATAEEALKVAGLGWHVEKESVFLKSGTEVPDQFAVVRQDIGIPLGIVGTVYRPLQNREAFSFFDAVVGEKLAMYHTAGSLVNGRKVWILAKLPGEVRVTGDDVTEKYLLLTNSHDGSSAVKIMFTPIRVVCQNTLNVAVILGERRQNIRHTATMGLKVSDVREGLGIINERFELFGEAARAMTQVQVNGEGWRAMLKDVGIIPADEGRKLTSRTENIMEEVSKLFEHGQGNDFPGVKGTAWGAFNALAEYADYHRGTRTQKGGPGMREQRADALLFGSGAKLKQKAWDAALVLAK